MVKPAGYNGPQLELVLKEPKADLKELCQHVFEKAGLSSASKIGLMTEDEPDGDLFNAADEIIKKHEKFAAATKVDAYPFLNEISLTKLPVEEENQKAASQFVSWAFTQCIEKIEELIDDEKELPH